MLKDIGEDTRDEALQDVELPRGVPVRGPKVSERRRRTGLRRARRARDKGL